jgi:hypothetical protein
MQRSATSTLLTSLTAAPKATAEHSIASIVRRVRIYMLSYCV